MENVKLFASATPVIKTFHVMEYNNIYSQQEHFSARHELLCILNGNMTLHFEHGQMFNAMPGDLLLIPCGKMHRDEFVLRKGLRVLFISFEWDMPDYFEKVNNLGLLQMNYSVRSEILRRLEFMRENWSDEPDKKLSASIQFHGILLLFYSGIFQTAETPSEEGKAPLRENMRRAKHFIDQNCTAQITLDEVARFAGMSPPYFSKLFHSEFGIGFSAYLTAVRLNTAQHLLQNTALQIAEIADRSGFSSSSYFIKTFTRYFGVSPKTYSRSVQK